MPDPSLLLSQSLDLQSLGIPNLGGDWDMDSSQFLSNSVEQPRHDTEILEDAGDLGLDLGYDEFEPLGPLEEGTSIEIGRDELVMRRPSEEFETQLEAEKELEDAGDLGLELGGDLTEDTLRPAVAITGADGDIGGRTG